MNGFKSFFKKSKQIKGIGSHDSHGGQSHAYLYTQKQPVWMERNYRKFANDAYSKNVIAYRCINMVAQAAASVPLKLYRLENGKYQPVESHKILDLLNKPNPIQSGKEFLESIYIYRQIHGNAYIMMTSSGRIPPRELYTIRPDRVSVLAGPDFLPSGYRYAIDNNYIDYLIDQNTGHCQILHIKNFHPLSDWYGLSPIEAAAYSIDQHNQACAWNQALLQNGARPSGAIIVKNSDGKPAHLNAEQFSNIKAMIDETFSGTQNAGRPLLLEGGLEWKEMSMSPKDMDFIESKHSSARDIALACRVPPQLLGIPGDNTYSNLVEAGKALWEQNIIPTIESTLDHFNRWLIPMFGEDLKICYDPEGISALSEKRDAMWNRINNIKFMIINEKRNAVGLASIDGLDSL